MVKIAGHYSGIVDYRKIIQLDTNTISSSAGQFSTETNEDIQPRVLRWILTDMLKCNRQ